MKIEILVSVDGKDTTFTDEVPDALAPMVEKILELTLRDRDVTPAEMAAMGIRGAVIDALADALAGEEPEEEKRSGPAPLCDCPECERELREFFVRNEASLPSA